MPRLVGKSSNKGLVYGGVFLLLAIVTGVTLEYMGVIDLVPEFGKSTSPSPVLSKDRPPVR
jgi:hypothetical protein